MDFGAQLRQARERRGISLRQISAATKISVSALEALERNDIARLPGGIFSRAFVRSYAVEVGLDPERTVREFLDRFQHDSITAGVASPREAPPEGESDLQSHQRTAGILLRLVLVSLPLMLAILYFTVGEKARGPSEAAALAAMAEPKPSDVPPPAPVVLAVDEEAAGIGPEPRGLVLAIEVTGPCWVSLTVDGRVVLARLLQPGERQVREVLREAVLEIGDAGAFAFTIDDRPGRALGRGGQVVTARIAVDNYATYLR